MCVGSDSGLGRPLSYNVYLPEWCFQVSAAGYAPSRLLQLNTREYHRKVRRIKPGEDRLIVPVMLRKADA
jgi:hypothetical protein